MHRTPLCIAPSARGAEDPILIGSLHDQSGPIASSGQQALASLELAVAEINDAGGVLGRPLQVVNYDTQSSIQMYSQFAQQLAVRDKVSVVHGGITTASREAVRPVFDRFKTLYFYNTLYEGGVCDRNTFCTRTRSGRCCTYPASMSPASPVRATFRWGSRSSAGSATIGRALGAAAVVERALQGN